MRRLISRQVSTDPTDVHPELSCADEACALYFVVGTKKSVVADNVAGSSKDRILKTSTIHVETYSSLVFVQVWLERSPLLYGH
jgi:hypothetical protein